MRSSNLFVTSIAALFASSLLIGSPALATGSTSPSPVRNGGSTATGAQVRDYYGISTHTTYRSSPQYGNDAKTLDLTIKAHPLWMRDLLSTQGGFDQDALWRKYVAQGVRDWHATVGVYGKTNDKTAIAARLVKSSDILTEVTGWNEPDGSGPISSWLAPTVAWQKWLYTTVKSNPATAHIKVGLGALRGANPNGSAEEGQLEKAAAGYFDFVDLHIYPGPNRNVQTVIDDHLAWAHGSAAMVSEFGGSTANMTLQDQSRVLTSGLQYLASKNIKCFIYELWDDPDSTGQVLQSNFGIYDSNGTPKPAETALAALVG
jgi:Cellulase (glycosyl hydrolase family 5)